MTNPSEYPSDGKIAEVREPVVRATILSPSDYIGTIMELCQAKRGSLDGMDYLSADRVEMRYTLPMGEIVFDFFDQLKSRTKGYASLDYERSGDQSATSSRSTSCSRVSPSTRSRRSCTGTRRTPMA